MVVSSGVMLCGEVLMFMLWVISLCSRCRLGSIVVSMVRLCWLCYCGLGRLWGFVLVCSSCRV